MVSEDQVFHYRYCAKENMEVQTIRNKYLPPKENKMDELRRLDRRVQNSGMVQSLSAGILGALIFGAGLCLSMGVMGSGLAAAALGVVLGLAGIAGMAIAYPVYRVIFKQTKAKWAPRILELASELSDEKRTE